MIHPTYDELCGTTLDIHTPPAAPVVLVLSAPTSFMADGYTVTACEPEGDGPWVVEGH